MRRTPGWALLAEAALELTALALFVALFDRRTDGEATASVPSGDPVDPRRFVREGADAQTRYFRAHDDSVAIEVGFFGDGRVRFADHGGRCFAGMVVGERADVLELATQRWSEAVVRTTPNGERELEMRGGPLAGRVFRCEAVEE